MKIILFVLVLSTINYFVKQGDVVKPSRQAFLNNLKEKGYTIIKKTERKHEADKGFSV
jgi:hypothetical protein